MRLNDEIRSPEVRLIAEDGSQLGVVPVAEARQIADERGLDLVELQPQATPPVAKLLDWGKYQYEQTKQKEKSKARGRSAEVKGVRLGLKTSPHDMETKAKRATEFLSKGHRVRIALILRGRENARPELGVEVLNRFIKSLEGVAVREGEQAKQGREISQVIAPIKE